MDFRLEKVLTHFYFYDKIRVVANNTKRMFELYNEQESLQHQGTV